VSYWHKMGGAILAAFLIGGPLAGLLGVGNKTFVGVAVGAIAFVLLSGPGRPRK
jgi:hypothetical protein